MSDPVTPAASTAADTAGLGRTLVDTFGKGWAKGDVPLLMSVFSDDAVFIETPFAQPRAGREAILNYWRDVPVHQAEVTFTSGEVFTVGPMVLCRIQGHLPAQAHRGVGRGPRGDVLRDGRRQDHRTPDVLAPLGGGTGGLKSVHSPGRRHRR